MPLQRRTQIAVIAFIVIMIASSAILRFAPANSMKSLSQISNPNQLSDPLEITDVNISSVLNGSSLFVLDFYYPGCGPCKFMNNTTSELANELQGQIKFGRMNSRTNKETVNKYKVSSYPTLLFFDDGVLVNRIKGNTSKSDLLAELKDLKPDLDTSKVRLQTAPTTADSGDIPLAKMGEAKPTKPMQITDSDIDLAVKKYPYLVIDGFTTWCEHCKPSNITLEQLSSELQGQVAFGLIDIDKNKATKIEYNITSYPTLLIFKDGELADKRVGTTAKSVLVSELKKHYPDLDTSNVNLTQPSSKVQSQAAAKPKLTPEQACANMTKSNEPLLEAFVVSQCPFGLQMQRIMAEMVDKSPKTEKYLKVRYIGSASNNTITSMHGDEEAQENLRQICIREEQSNKYWDYVRCYMKEGKSSDCLNSASIDKGKLESCARENGRGLAYAEKDFDLANRYDITGSPTLMLNGKIASEFDFATNTTNGRSPEALKELLCCAFNTKPSFCSQELNGTRAMTMYSVQTKTVSATTQQAPGRDIPLTKLGGKNPSQAMLITDNTMNSAVSQYPLLVTEAFMDWCGYCKNLNVTVSELSSELQGQVAFGLIDMGKNNLTKTNYNVTSYPTMLIFKDGKLVNQIVGNEQKSSLVAKLKKIEPNLNTSKVKIAQTAQTPPKPKLTPEQVCVNMTKYGKPLLEVFVVSKCPFGLQMQRIMANLIDQSNEAKDYLKVRYIGNIANNTVTSMHGDEEAQENLRQICIREEQSNRYWDYVGCYMKEGKSSDCLNSTSVDKGKIESCMKETDRGLTYSEKDFNLAEKYSITGSPTLLIGGTKVKESDFATNTTNSRSPEALKDLLCCAFKKPASFCSLQFNESRAATMFSAK